MQIFGILPAAGRSERMGAPKLLLPWGDATLIEHVVGVWRSSRVSRVLVVVHPDDARLAELAERAGALVVRPERAPVDMKASVGYALAYAARFGPEAGDAWMLAPADMPLLSAATIDRLIEAYARSAATADGGSRIWVPCLAGRRGHPVLFPWTLAAEVARLGADEGLNTLLARHRVETVEAGEEAIFEDIDTPEDYDRLRARLEK